MATLRHAQGQKGLDVAGGYQTDKAMRGDRMGVGDDQVERVLAGCTMEKEMLPPWNIGAAVASDASEGRQLQSTHCGRPRSYG